MIATGKRLIISKILYCHYENKVIYLYNYIFSLGLNNLYAIDPEIFVQSTVTELQKFCQKIFLKKKMLELKNIAKDTVDINGIGFYTLGAIRKNLDNEQKIGILIYLKIFLKSFLVDWQSIQIRDRCFG